MLLHLPVGLSSHQTAQRRLSGAHSDRSQSHRQWLAVTAPAGRAHAVERVEATCRREPRCCQTKQVPKKGVEGRRREARRTSKKLRFISRGKKALAHPSPLPLKAARHRFATATTLEQDRPCGFTESTGSRRRQTLPGRNKSRLRPYHAARPQRPARSQSESLRKSRADLETVHRRT